MEVSRHEKDGAQIVKLRGEVDLQTSPQVRDAVLGSLGKKGPVVVDMGDIEYIDSSGVACLVEGYQKARQQGTAFSLARVSPAAMRVLKLARLDKVFTIFLEVDDALKAKG